MSKAKSSSSLLDVANVSTSLSHGFGILISETTPSSLVGRVLEIIEAVGMPEKQENSIKNLVKDVIYKSFDQDNTVVIKPALNDLIHKVFYSKRSDPQSSSHAVDLIDVK